MGIQLRQLLSVSLALILCHCVYGQSVSDQAALLSAASAGSYPQTNQYLVGYPQSQQQQYLGATYPGSQLYGNAYLSSPTYNHLTRPLYPRMSLTARLRNMMKSWLKTRNYAKPYYQPVIPGLAYGKPEHLSSKPIYVSASNYKPVSIPYYQAQKYYKSYYPASATSQRGYYVQPQYSSQKYATSGSTSNAGSYASAYSPSISDSSRGSVADVTGSSSSKYGYSAQTAHSSSYPVQASYSTGYDKVSASAYKPTYQKSSFQPVAFNSQSSSYKSSASSYPYDSSSSNSAKIV